MDFHCKTSSENVVTVAAIRADGYISEISNYSDVYVDIAAPGADIATIDGKGRVLLRSGTSYAVPFVVATAVRIKSCLGDVSPRDIKKR